MIEAELGPLETLRYTITCSDESPAAIMRRLWKVYAMKYGEVKNGILYVNPRASEGFVAYCMNHAYDEALLRESLLTIGVRYDTIDRHRVYRGRPFGKMMLRALDVAALDEYTRIKK